MYDDLVEGNRGIIEISVPVELVPYIKKAESNNLYFSLLLYPLIQKGDMSYGQVAEMFGVDGLDLIEYYGESGIPYVDYSPKELDEELEVLRKLRKNEAL